MTADIRNARFCDAGSFGQVYNLLVVRLLKLHPWKAIDRFQHLPVIESARPFQFAYSRPADWIADRAGGAKRRFHYLSRCQELKAQTKGVN
jgi:hypothetical protein